MDVSPQEAQKALDAIETMMKKARRAISNSGAYVFLIIWGFVWLFGFSANHFFSGKNAGYVWMVLDILGGILSVVMGIRLGQVVRSASGGKTGQRIGWFWLLLAVYCMLLLLVAAPADMKQRSMIIVIFVMIGWMAMGLLLSSASVWWGLAITALALIGYYLLPGIFYLWMAVLGGGGMVTLGFFIRKRW
ncbi:MAG: hypothetical protein E4H33_01190 [Anaerolineales bacterium]|nr:MAG: hypothetical protein E4H33_01190 [Anaerolineales bacterium]